ncbi:LOW QUALITY PROTEIN: hypothetical protein OSB04_016875 [Centaurea solstitialis]|uniref:Uncharacterized protein n=1 Tax=Centaurea solstitialis TaxID=347529 RepID=A0AA38WHV9_9ASTR|nr:LOW QUALITY PROTEIN: hypothetical protein OSB04_016875 [Centaurea solstitialis]
MLVVQARDDATFSSTQPEKFSGSGDPLTLKEWFNKIESCSKSCECAPDKDVLGWPERTTDREVPMWLDKRQFLNLEYIDKFTEKARVDIERYVEVIVPKTFLQVIEVTKITEKSSDKLIEVGNDVRRKWEDSCKRFKNVKFESVRELPVKSSCNKSHFGECKIGSIWCWHNQRECLNSRKCFKCRIPGHMRPNSPTLQKATTGSLTLVSGASRSGNEKKEL